MGGMKISNLDFLRLLPVFMRDDEAVIALSKAVNVLLGEPGKRLDTIRTWDKIDELNEAECDELAWELDIDWYDSGGMSLEEKRNTIKVAQQIKRKRGTKWAVERLISAYFGEGHVLEWNELEGTPYSTPFTFIVLIEAEETTPENLAKFTEAAKAAKNARSHIAGIFCLWQQGPDPGVEYALDAGLHRYEIEQCGTRNEPATVGMLAKNGIETEPEGKAYLYSVPQAGEIICGTYPHVVKVEAVFPDTSIKFTGGTSKLVSGYKLYTGETYLVHWNGTKYTCVAGVYDGTIYIGNPALFTDGALPATDYPFCITTFGGNGGFVNKSVSGAETITLRIDKVVGS